MAAETNPLEITTINGYFSKIYEGKQLQEFYAALNDKLFSYKYPSEICLSSNFEDATLLGTLNFTYLDVNHYPMYFGDIERSAPGQAKLIYDGSLYYDQGLWKITLSSGFSIIEIPSSITTSLDPTKVNYEGISRPTSGACQL